MIFNTPTIQIIDDQDHQAVIKITGMYTSACTASNSVVVQANSLFGANSSLPCMISVNAVEYSTSIANGALALEYVSTVNNNTTITTCGRNSDGQFARYIKNQANTPSGDINLLIDDMEANDAYTIIVSVLKEYQGAVWATPATMNVGPGYGAGAWANAVASLRNPGGY